MIPLADALVLLAAVGLALFWTGWAGSYFWHREAPEFDQEPDQDASWPPPLPPGVAVEVRSQLAGYAAAMLEQAATVAQIQGQAELGQAAPVARLHLVSWVPPSERAEPEPLALEPDTDRMATIAEMRETADYRVAWTELDQQMDSARRWYDETYNTGQFGIIKPD